MRQLQEAPELHETVLPEEGLRQITKEEETLMFIFFHGMIFDPADLLTAQADGDGLWIQIAGANSGPALITSESMSPQALLGDLYQIMLETGIAYQPESGPEFELDGDEQKMLSKALADGYEWVARDKSGGIYAYRKKPVKRKSTYEDPWTPDPVRLEQDWFSEIDFNAGPISISYMLLNS